MAETYWPFDGVDTSETQFSQWARNFGEGVKGNPTSTDLLVTANGSGMTVSLAAGQAMVRGHYYYNNTGSTLSVTTAHATLNRIDLVVLTLDPTANTIVASVLAGTAAASPVAPSLTQTDAGVYQIALAQIYVGAAVTNIQLSNITDVRPFLGDLNLQNSFVAGKNRIINGAFDVWQRGTSFSGVANLAYTADRWQLSFDGSGGSRSVSQATFTPGAAPVPGYEGAYYLAFSQTTAGSGGTYNKIQQRIEGVRSFAGQTITVSFWVNVAQSMSISVSATQNFGTGGSSNVTASGGSQTISNTFTWQRVAYKINVPSIAGKTIGTANDNLVIEIGLPTNVTQSLSIWGVQVEAGLVPTAFVRAGGEIAAELAKCQRYYYRITASASYDIFAFGSAISTTAVNCNLKFPVTMRTVPTLSDTSSAATFRLTDGATSNSVNGGSVSLQPGTTTSASSSVDMANLYVNVTGALTQFRNYQFGANNTIGAWLGFSAEL